MNRQHSLWLRFTLAFLLQGYLHALPLFRDPRSLLVFFHSISGQSHHGIVLPQYYPAEIVCLDSPATSAHDRLKLSRQKISLNINWKESIYHFLCSALRPSPRQFSIQENCLIYDFLGKILCSVFQFHHFSAWSATLKKSLSLLNLFSNVRALNFTLESLDRSNFERSVWLVVWIILRFTIFTSEFLTERDHWKFLTEEVSCSQCS